MNLSKNFTLSELTKSQTATRLGINNTPSSQQIFNLKNLCENVLQKIRDRFEKPVIVSSGFRSIELCHAIGSSAKSQHAKGQAADIEIPGVSNKDLSDWISQNVSFDQVILEFHDPIEPNSGWVHVSFVSEYSNRENYLIAEKDENGKVRYSKCP